MPGTVTEEMTANRRETMRETAISAGINAVLSAAFYTLAFGMTAAPAPAAFAADFGVQSAAVAFMGALVPALLVGRRRRAADARRALVAAVIMAILAVVAGLSLGRTLVAYCLSPAQPSVAIAIKVVWGITVSFVVTPIAVRLVQRRAAFGS